MPTVGASYASKAFYYQELDKNIKYEVKNTVIIRYGILLVKKDFVRWPKSSIKVINKTKNIDASAVILTYDITRKESFEQIRSFWHSQVVENAPKNVSKYLVN